MSNIYIQEPPTSGKVLLKTSVGDIDIELWCRETPKTCRNFIQLCMEGYYNDTLFHRLVPGFIVQGGDPNGDGTGGESIYGGTFKDEFHSRLRFIRRGLVAMANAGGDDNAAQFFFTLGEAPELQNKHTLFGKVTGDTVFNMLKLEDGVEVDHNERPLFPHRILRTEVLLNPFEDIVPRVLERKRKTGEKRKKKEKGVKNFGLLSFGNEAEEDEEQTNEFVQKTAGRAKSMHDVVDDPKLSKDTETFVKIEKEDDVDPDAEMDEDRAAAIKDAVRNKLQAGTTAKKATKESKKESRKAKAKPPTEKPAKETVEEVEISDSGSDDLNNELERERRLKRKKDADNIREQIAELKKTYQKDKRDKDAAVTQGPAKSKDAAAADVASAADAQPQNKMMQLYLSEQRKYADRKTVVPKKKDAAAHEQQTLELLARFKSKLNQVMYASSDDDGDDDADADAQCSKAKKPKPTATTTTTTTTPADSGEADDIEGDDWLAHTLRFEDATTKAPVLAKDASTKQDDWYDAFDPRNPLNKRKRGGDEPPHNSRSKSNGGGGGHGSRRHESTSGSSRRTGEGSSSSSRSSRR